MGAEDLHLYILNTLIPQGSHAQFLSSIFSLLTKIIESPIYDTTWWALIMLQFDSIAQFLQLGNNLRSYCSPSNPLEMNLCKDYLALSLNFISTDVLALESFSSTKRALIQNNFGDLRTKVIEPLKVIF